MLTLDQLVLEELFTIDEATGSLFWKVAPSRNTVDGQRAGFTRKGRPRRFVKIMGTAYPEHVVVWVMLNGAVPPGHVVDHEDRDEGNNRPGNLRALSVAENCQNRSFRGGNPAPGVYANKSQWAAYIKMPGEKRRTYIGLYPTVDEAIAARTRAVSEAGSKHLVCHPLPKFQD